MAHEMCYQSNELWHVKPAGRPHCLKYTRMICIYAFLVGEARVMKLTVAFDAFLAKRAKSKDDGFLVHSIPS
jgi:hypothetical protein